MGTAAGFFTFHTPRPAYFLLRYFTASEEVGVYMLLTLVSLAAGSAVGLIAALLLFFFRRHWRKLRGRLAAGRRHDCRLRWFRQE